MTFTKSIAKVHVWNPYHQGIVSISKPISNLYRDVIQCIRRALTAQYFRFSTLEKILINVRCKPWSVCVRNVPHFLLRELGVSFACVVYRKGGCRYGLQKNLPFGITQRLSLITISIDQSLFSQQLQRNIHLCELGSVTRSSSVCRR